MQQQYPLLAYEKVYYNGEIGFPSYYTYRAHRIYRASASFLWVNEAPLWREAYTQAHPETLRTYRLNRVALEERGEWKQVRQGVIRDWVLALPSTARETSEGVWVDHPPAV